MKSNSNKYWQIFTGLVVKFKKQSSVLALFLLVAVALETVSVGSVLPLLQVMLGNAPSLPNFLGRVGAKFMGGSVEGKIYYFSGAIILLFLIRMLVQLLKEYYSTRYTNTLREYWSSKIFKNLVYGDLLSLKEIKHGHLINNMINEPIYASKGVNDFIDVLISCLMLISLTVLLLWIDWKTTTMASLVLLGGVGIVWRVSSKYSESVGKARVLMNQEINQIITESASGIRQIKVFSIEQKVLSELKHCLSTLMKTLNRFAVANVAPKEVGEFVVMCLVVGGLLVGKFILGKDPAKLLPEIAVFAASFIKLFSAASLLLSKRMGVATYWPSIQAVETYSVKRPLERLGVSSLPVRFDQAITANDLVFSFSEEAKVLRGISFELKKGEIIGLAGRSGSGKSTLCDVLAKLLTPTSGTVRVDGKDLSQMDTWQWRKRIGYVSQDTFLFNTTVMNNILIGCEHLDKAVALRAAEQAQALAFIEKLPQGLETVVGTGGLSLSGGQKQRIGLAQALARDPDLLILDETTSGLDYESEAEILNTLRKESKNRCVLIITHRLNTLKFVDRVLFLDHGRIAEMGPFSELYRANGGFKMLLDKEISKQPEFS